MSIYRQRLEDDLDKKLNLQYFAISFHENQKEKAQRLLKPQENRQAIGQTLSNEQVLCYVKDVYLKYGIQDPILKMRKQRGTLSLPIKDKEVNFSDRLTKTKKKLVNLKESFKNNPSEVIKKEILSTSFKQGSYNPHKITIEKQKNAIGYRTKQKIRFKTETEQVDILISPYSLRDQLNCSYNYSRNQSLSFSITNKKQAEKKYMQFCPFCEQDLSLGNYQNHSGKCEEFKGIEIISIEKLLSLVELKITEIQRRLLLELNKKTPKTVADQFQKIRLELMNWIDMGNSLSYEIIQSDFNSFSLRLCKEMSKLQWFRDFHDSLYLPRRFDPYL